MANSNACDKAAYIIIFYPDTRVVVQHNVFLLSVCMSVFLINDRLPCLEQLENKDLYGKPDEGVILD